MTRQELVARLVETAGEHENLLAKFPEFNDLELAFALKDVFYTAWTTEPEKVQNAALALRALAKFNSDAKIPALADWVAGIAALTRGKPGEAVVRLDEAATAFRRLNEDCLAAQTQVSKLYALALLGKYDEAIECGQNAIKIFELNGDELAAGKIEQNLGNISWRRDRYAEGEKYLTSARERYLRLNNQTHLTMAENNLAFVYALQNKFRDSENMYRQALEGAQTLNLTVTQAEIEASMGDLALFRGRFDEALKFLENSRQKYFSLKMPHQESIAELEIADVYLELNLAPEAIEIYQKVAPKFAELKMQAEEARARLQFGRALVLLGKNAEALKELEKAAALYSAEGNKVGVGVVRRTEARLSLRGEKWKTAAQLSIAAEQIFDEAGSLRNQLIAAWMHGEALRNLAQIAESQTLLENTLKQSLENEQPNIALLCQTSLGKLASATNEIAKARNYFQKAIETIENLRAPLPADEFRTAFLADKLVPYQELGKISLSENEPAEAFRFVERARSRSLAEMMNFHVKLPEKNLNKSSAKLQLQLGELREELNWYYSRLNRPAVGEMKEATPDVENWQTSANQIEHRIAELSRQLNSLNDNTFVADTNLNLKFLQQELGDERALVEYACLDREILAFVVTNERVTVVEHLGNEEEIRAALEQLQMQFGTLRYGAKNLKQYFPQLIKRTNFYLQKLYEKLVEPLEHLLGERHLVVVPYKSLHYVPFQALFDGERYLIENRGISYAPGAVVLQHCLQQNLKIKNDLRVLLIGVADEKIPLVEEEIQTLKQIFPHADELRNEQAVFAVFKKYAPQADVLHLACHGQFRPDNPLFSSLHLADGRITVRDVCALELNARLAVLSACETGLNLVAEGDEILGLARGFFMAGVNSLLLTLWTVSDEATINLMKSFYTHLQTGKPLAQALREAQVEFIRQNSHPYYWSPFALIGSWK